MIYSDINTPEELYLFMKDNIKYGFVSSCDNKKYNRKELNNDELYEKVLFESYFLQTPKQLLKSGYGLCFDQVMFAKEWLEKHDYIVKTYYSPYRNHTFLIYKDKDEYIFFERTFKKYNGLKRFKSLNDIFIYYINIQVSESDTKITSSDIKIKEFNLDKYGLNFYELKKYLMSNRNVKLKSKLLTKKI